MSVLGVPGLRGHLQKPDSHLTFLGLKKKMLECFHTTFLTRNWHASGILRVEVDFVGLHARFVSCSVWVPSVDLKLLDSGLCCSSRCSLSTSRSLNERKTKRMTVLKWTIRPTNCISLPQVKWTPTLTVKQAQWQDVELWHITWSTFNVDY